MYLQRCCTQKTEARRQKPAARINHVLLASGFWILASLLGCSRTPTQGVSAPRSESGTSSQPPILAISAEQKSRPPLEIIKGDGNLGTADFGEERTCSFTIRNNTREQIELELGEKSCSCAGVQLEAASVAPNQTITISLLWAPKAEAVEASTVRLWAELHASRLAKPLRLEATGKLEPKVQVAFPRGPLEFGKFSASDLSNPVQTLIVEVFSKSTPFQLQSVRSSLPGLQVVEPALPIPADRLVLLGAKGGYRLALKPTEHLPHGDFQGIVQIKTDLNDHLLIVPYHGIFETTAISLNHERIELPPRLNLKQNYRIPPVLVNVRYGTCTSCVFQSVTPSFLGVKVSQQDLKTWRVEVQLPTTADDIRSKLTPEEWRQVQTFGFESGEIILKCDHPEVKQISIPISGCLLRFE